jgi:hypothetical protein
MIWEQLDKVYKTSGIVLALGAGVSVGSGLPNWVELLRRIAVNCIGRDGRKLVDDLRQKGFGYPAIAGMLKTQCTESNFADLVRETLYSDFPQDFRTVDWRDWERPVEYVKKKNLTLRAIAALCAITTESPKQFNRNPRIHAVINFNIDAVFRNYVRARYPHVRARYPHDRASIVRSVERPSKNSELEKISVYYMHGYLRFDAKAGQPDSEASDNLVLSEHEYFDVFNSPTSLFNYTFLSMLREYSCLFIGLSMQDDNIRRLLHYSTKERFRAYREEGKNKSVAQDRARRHFAILPRYGSDAIDTLVEKSLAELGTHVLWTKGHEEIPKRLGQMYSAAGGDWNSVY